MPGQPVTPVVSASLEFISDIGLQERLRSFHDPTVDASRDPCSLPQRGTNLKTKGVTGPPDMFYNRPNAKTPEPNLIGGA